MKLLIPFLLAVAIASAADLPEAPSDPSANLARARALVDSLKPQSGEVTLPKGLAKLTLPTDLNYLNPDDSSIVLGQIWGNRVNEKPLGMIVPKDFDPMGESSWAVVITYIDEGHVKDHDAAKINYDDLLKEMKSDVREANKERVKEGYDPVELIGWAAPPRYDSATHKLYWAKEIKFGASAENTLNYNIRILGRSGVLQLNTVAGIADLKIVEQVTPKILAAVDFQAGNRYADFNQDTDKVATYGVAALVAGGVAAKTGLLKAAWVGLLAFKKVLIIGVIACGAFVKKLFTRKTPSDGLRQE